MKITKSIRVFGKVQGVGYRYATVAVARRLKLSGFVRNEPQGSVYIEVEGEENSVKKFEGWCREGPPLAMVSEIISVQIEPGGYYSFKVIK